MTGINKRSNRPSTGQKKMSDPNAQVYFWHVLADEATKEKRKRGDRMLKMKDIPRKGK